MISYQWIWKNRTQTVLLVFCLYPEEGYSNLRLDPLDFCLTWAPSHEEQGYIAELLSLANRVNGYPPEIRRRFWQLHTYTNPDGPTALLHLPFCLPLCSNGVEFSKEALQKAIKNEEINIVYAFFKGKTREENL